MTVKIKFEPLTEHPPEHPQIKRGGLFLLPSNTLKIIVQYRPEWIISCVVPPQNRTLKLTNETEDEDENWEYEDDSSLIDAKMEVPALLMSQRMELYETPDRLVSDSDFELSAIDLSFEDKLWITPFHFANVDNSGGICFGEVGQPTNLRSANSLFWESPFNEDYTTFRRDHFEQCDDIEHEYYDHEPRQHCENIKHQCKCKKVHFHGTGHLVRTNAVKYDSNCACCQRTCGCVISHKAGCECRFGECSCVCGEANCQHCKFTCNCPGCMCLCCREECDCRCSCNMRQTFIDWIKDYPASLPTKQWMNATSLYCGQAFISTPNKVDAIFISLNRDFINSSVPQNQWRKMPNGRPAAIGFANLLPDSNWEISFGPETKITLTEQNLEIV